MIGCSLVFFEALPNRLITFKQFVSSLKFLMTVAIIDSDWSGLQHVSVDRRNLKCWKMVDVADAKLSEASMTLVEIGLDARVPSVFIEMMLSTAVNFTTCSEELFLGWEFQISFTM